MEKNLQSADAIKKLRELAEEIDTCMFITKPGSEDSSRPMATIKAEEDGTLWFFTPRSSGKAAQIEQEHDVHLIYAHPGKQSFMDLWGRGSIVTDRSKMRELWKPLLKAWFKGGEDDPDLCLLKVVPATAYYWDSEEGKMVVFLKILTSAVTGKRIDEGVEGELNVNR